MTRFDMVLDALKRDCGNGVHFARQILCSGEEGKEYLSGKIRELFDSLPAGFRLLAVDLNAYSGFPGMLKDILRQIFSDPKFQNTDTLVTKDEIEAEENAGELRFLFECIVNDDFAEEQIFVLLLINHYEKAGEIWEPTDFGWLRGVLTDAKMMSVAVLSEKTVDKVSMEPAGSSPFANIFDPPERIDE